MAELNNQLGTCDGVVVIDDDEMILEIVSWATQALPYRVNCFSVTADAMSYTIKHPPKVLIVDYYMPGQSGLDVIKQLTTFLDVNLTSIYICSALPPKEITPVSLAAMGLQLLDKDTLCSRDSLVALLEQHFQK